MISIFTSMFTVFALTNGDGARLLLYEQGVLSPGGWIAHSLPSFELPLPPKAHIRANMRNGGDGHSLAVPLDMPHYLTKAHKHADMRMHDNKNINNFI